MSAPRNGFGLYFSPLLKAKECRKCRASFETRYPTQSLCAACRELSAKIGQLKKGSAPDVV